MERVENLVRLALTPGVGPVTVNRLLKAFGNSDALLGASEESLCAVEGIRKNQVMAVLQAGDSDPRPELDLAAQHNVNIIAYDDPAYPAQLKEIYDPPFLLYCRGELKPEDCIGIGMVGTRRSSRYGAEQAERFGGLLARSGFSVISGLARGIDSFAHKGCLSCGGRTLAVIGCGLCHMYPEENRDLAAEIAGNGAVISEFTMETLPSRENFPRRNRIIAGLSLGILVVEAPTRSGALITARHAYEMGRSVMAIPGHISQEMAEGCNKLIRDGATLIRNMDDILDELGPVAEEIRKSMPVPVEAPKKTPLDESDSESKAKVELGNREQQILEILSDSPVHIDKICNEMGLPVHQISATLMVLELKRQVSQQPGKFFVKIGRS
ncbi:MAG: DNA-processing protein DprA [Planctomycetes bacterium]|nr:DNA-processing protein DprA [Planctomycetota bacterium]